MSTLSHALLDILGTPFPLAKHRERCRILLTIIYLFCCLLLLFQHEFLQLVDDEVLAYPSDSVLAVLLGVNAHYAIRLLALLTVAFLVVEDAPWQ